MQMHMVGTLKPAGEEGGQLVMEEKASENSQLNTSMQKDANNGSPTMTSRSTKNPLFYRHSPPIPMTHRRNKQA